MSGTATAVIAGQTQQVQGTLTFTNSSILGTLIHAGQQQYEVTFTPTDSTDYASTQSEVTVTVNKATSQINAGTQAVAVTFTPFDTSDFNSSSGSVEVTVKAATPTISTPTSTHNPANVGELITFTVVLTAPSGDTPQGTVTFYAGATDLGTVNVETVKLQQGASCSISTLSSGTYSITAVYKDTVDSDIDSVPSAALQQDVLSNRGN